MPDIQTQVSFRSFLASLHPGLVELDSAASRPWRGVIRLLRAGLIRAFRIAASPVTIRLRFVDLYQCHSGFASDGARSTPNALVLRQSESRYSTCANIKL